MSSTNGAGLNDLWAKSGADGRPGETLLAHTHAVVTALARMAYIRPDLPTTAGCPQLWRWAFWACFFHDLGKAAHGFQRQLRDGARWGHRHEVASLGFLNWQVETPDHEWIASGIASHHKDLSDLQRSYPVDDESAAFAELAAQIPTGLAESLLTAALDNEIPLLGRFVREGLIEAAPLEQQLDIVTVPTPENIARGLQAFYRLARSLQRGQRKESDVLASIVLRGLVITADHMASAHARPIEPTLTSVGRVLRLMGRAPYEVYPHQRECANVSGSVLLTAPTGSGKTESALLWAAQQNHDVAIPPRLFYVLPFQASMNAMRLRLASFFPGEVGLQHGRALHALYRAYLQEDTAPAHAARKARWARNLSDLHAYPIKVLSPYQLLKAAYRLRGYEAIITDCFGGWFIFDELHAYEPERLGMILKMMEWLHRHARARFCVMTATMPPHLTELIKTLLPEIGVVRAWPDFYEKSRRHRLSLNDGEVVDALEAIVNLADSGASILVCCNTVRRAQQVYEQLKPRLSEVQLLHSRFTARDRLQKEAAYSSDPSTPVRPAGVLVATQVVEVSLNLDFDTIFTEPAPLEALLQRFGRVNRMGRRGEPVPVHVFRHPTDGQHVYAPEMVQRSLHILEAIEGQVIDESRVEAWLGDIYHGEVLDDWMKRYHHAAREFEAACLETLHAFDSNDELEDAFYRTFDNVDVLPACLETEYDRLQEEEPILASELLVGISWRQLQRQERAGLVRRQKGGPPVVEAAYSSEVGLSLG